MGFLRFILAAAVVAGHSSSILGLPLLNAGLAVKTFFMISGFYMALILTSKYDRKQYSILLFYSNRWLRIFPMYYCVLVASVAFYLLSSCYLHKPIDRLAYWFEAAALKEFGSLALISISQFTIAGLDVTPLFSFSAEHGFSLLGNNTGVIGDNILAWRFNFLPHCWAIGVLLVFYIFAPVLVRARTSALWGIVLLNLTAIPISYALLPETLAKSAIYHFAPYQFMYFVLGILSFRLIYFRNVAFLNKRWQHWILIIPFAVMTLCGGIIDNYVTQVVTQVAYPILAFFSIPLLFLLSQESRLERLVGDLSYPMYLSHIFVKWFILALMGVAVKDTVIVSGIQLLIGTVAISLAMLFSIDYPIDKFRQKRVTAARNL